MVEVLTHFSESKNYVSTSVSIEASGLLRKMQDKKFAFLAQFMLKILMLIQPPNAILQSFSMDMVEALNVIEAVERNITTIRNDEEFLNVLIKSSSTELEETEDNIIFTVKRQKRICKPSNRLDGMLLYEGNSGVTRRLEQENTKKR